MYAIPKLYKVVESVLNQIVNNLNFGQCFSYLYRGFHEKEPEKRRVYECWYECWSIFYKHIVKADLFEAQSYFG